ncbi:hypothetical protein [Polynucleobacter sp. UK-Kesae-W10]|uniref:hypothetical protein n=1 Tax=Polynucleobacter sp. UK-Kesae-W10 TaxID=1819738 RepID=UPI001C0AA802|nr:hypothetical protein [Polynucleobacter sp. UK-Kesae-W10]MBU3577727.1 hypothetical protein [Polynucleobacter sp. UK-Kesae-W10]
MSNYLMLNHLSFIKFLPLFFFTAIVLFLVIGWLHGRYRLKHNGTVIVRDSLAASIFGLSALVLGFTFSSANDHFTKRIGVNRAEAYSIERVYQSTKYLLPQDQIVAKKALDKLIETRLKTFINVDTEQELDSHLEALNNQVSATNEVIISAIARAPVATQNYANKILAIQLGEMVQAFEDGALAAKAHPPAIIERCLLVLLCVGSLLSGYTMAVHKEEDWFLTAIYLALMGFSLFVIFTLEFPNQLFSYEAVNVDLLRIQRLYGAASSPP